MSDTPLTDAAKWGTDRVTVDFARTIERHARALASALEHCQECCDGPCCAKDALRAWKEYSNTP
jgi:hypothetical protein